MKSPKKGWLIGFGAIACMALTGCVSMSTGGWEVVASEGGTPTVRVDDTIFAQHVAVEDVHSHRTAEGYLAVLVQVRNKYSEDFPIQYKFTWFDANGMEVQPNGRPWEQVTLHGGESVPLSATGPEPTVVRFTMRARRMTNE